MTYSISFTLLLPKPLLLRLDTLPFLLIYGALIYLFYLYYEDSDLNLYLRLGSIFVAFCNCLVYIGGCWSKKMQVIVQYNKIGMDERVLEKGSHVLIIEKKDGYAPCYGIVDFYKQEQEGRKPFYFCYFQSRKFYYDYDAHKFMRLKPLQSTTTIGSLLGPKSNVSFDANILQIPIRPFSSIFRDQLIDPFSFFQLFSIFLWLLDDNRIYSLLILVMLIGSGFAVSVQRIKTLVGYRSMTLMPHDVQVYQDGSWTTKSSYQLLPGDIIAVTAGYHHKKSPIEIVPDQQILAASIPFASKLPKQLLKTPNRQESTSHRNLPCDLLILAGSCVVNQSILTGEAVPQVKEPVGKEMLDKRFKQSEFKGSMLYCGTEVVQVNDPCSEAEIKSFFDGRQIREGFKAPSPPHPSCVLALVLKTGYDTTKGKLIRQVLSNAQNQSLEQKDGLVIIVFLLICSIITAIYVLSQGMKDENRSKEKLFLRCILILTTVVPPQLPMILNLAVNNSILYLQKKRIFVSEPKKIPLGGKVKVVAFDKTGTLTEDKFIFEGIVDDCLNPALKTLETCSHQNHIILASCHSLISLPELTGDPIELMFFEKTKWEFNSKSKEARRGAERIKIQKVFPFKSELKRMSCIVEWIGERRQSRVVVKGAPQAIQSLLQVVPPKYKEAYSQYTRQGYRLLALASKKVNNGEYTNSTLSKSQLRTLAQSQLTFQGFFICSSPLKSDTAKHIRSLLNARYSVKIITGDNILTANKVGEQIGLGKEAWIIQKQKDTVVVIQGSDSKGVSQKHPIHSVKELEKIAHTQGIFLSTSISHELPPSYYPLITIFARASPHDKQHIVKHHKHLGILYAGDGTNDVGGLRIADVGVAVVGVTGMSEVEKKEEEVKEKKANIEKRISQVQRDIGMGFKKKMEILSRLMQERNMLVGPSSMLDDEIKVGDACIAAPFTSKHSSSIQCVLIIIRQAVATLVTTIQTYKILAISSILMAYSLAEMNLVALKYSQTQTFVMGILASVNFYYFSNSKPLKTISHIRAPSSIFSIYFAISFFGQIFIFTFCNYYVLHEIGLHYLPQEDKGISADTQFKKSFLNTVLFLFNLISQSAVFIVNHGGQPHMESLIKNSRYFKFLIIPLVVCFVLTANISADLSNMVDLKFEGIPEIANYEMLIVFGIMVVGAFGIDRACKFAQFKEVVGWF